MWETPEFEFTNLLSRCHDTELFENQMCTVCITLGAKGGAENKGSYVLLFYRPASTGNFPKRLRTKYPLFANSEIFLIIG